MMYSNDMWSHHPENPEYCGQFPGNEIDGMNVRELVPGLEAAENPHAYYAFSNNRSFEGVLSGNGRWKLHLPHPYPTLMEAGWDAIPGTYVQESIDTALFDMANDPLETTNVLVQHPEAARELIQMAETHRSRFYLD